MESNTQAVGLARKLYASSENLRSEPLPLAAWHQASEISYWGNSAHSVWKHLAVLRKHCDSIGRPFNSVLRTHFTGWLILAENEEHLRAKLKSYFPEGLDQRFSGPWSGFAMACTPERAISYYQELVDAGIQYFIVQTLDAADEETIRLLGEQVMPAMKK